MKLFDTKKCQENCFSTWDFESPEDDLWNLPPSKNDWYAGWAKRMGELQAETYKIQ